MDKNLIKILSEMVSIKSIFPQEEEMVNYVEKILKEYGFKTKRQRVSQGRYSLFASRGSGKKALMFYGHLDTVKPDKDWTGNPFKLSMQGNLAKGLGAYDMKGGIAAFLNAVSKVDNEHFIKIFLAVDEENISEGAWVAVKKEKSFFHDVELVISAEPGLGNGLNTIANSRVGRVIYEAVFKGKAQHIINHDAAIDAIEQMGIFINSFYKKRDKIFKSKETFAQVRKVYGESLGMSVCGECSLEIEVLLDFPDTINSVNKILKNISNSKTTEIKLKKRNTPYLEAYAFKEIPYILLIKKIIKEQLGKDLKLYKKVSVGDDNVLASLKIPVITWGPEGKNAHKANEAVDIQSMQALSEMYIKLLNTVGTE